MPVSVPKPLSVLHSTITGPVWDAPIPNYNFLGAGSGNSGVGTVRWARGLTYVLGWHTAGDFAPTTAGFAIIRWDEDAAGLPTVPTITHQPVGVGEWGGGVGFHVGQVTDTFFDAIWGGRPFGSDSVFYHGVRCTPQPDGSLSLGPQADVELPCGTGADELGFAYMDGDLVAVAGEGFRGPIRVGSINLATGGSSVAAAIEYSTLFPEVSFAAGNYSGGSVVGGQAGPGVGAFPCVVSDFVGPHTNYFFAGVMNFTPGGVSRGTNYASTLGPEGSSLGGGGAYHHGPTSFVHAAVATINGRLKGSEMVPFEPWSEFPDAVNRYISPIPNDHHAQHYAGYGPSEIEVNDWVYREHSYEDTPVPFQYAWMSDPAVSPVGLIEPMQKDDYSLFMDWKGNGVGGGSTRIFRVWYDPQRWKVGSIGG